MLLVARLTCKQQKSMTVAFMVRCDVAAACAPPHKKFEIKQLFVNQNLR